MPAEGSGWYLPSLSRTGRWPTSGLRSMLSADQDRLQVAENAERLKESEL